MPALPRYGSASYSPVDLLSLALSLALPMSGARFTGDYRFDVNPVFGVPYPTGNSWGAAATVLPGMVLHDPQYAGTQYDIRSNPHLMRHELGHVEQQGALGPGFWLAYALSGGDPFEPYDPRNLQNERGRSNVERHDMRQAWMPPDDMRGQFPLFRVSREGGSTSLQFLPGYPQLGEIKVKR